jgi:hypothetical protein
VCVGVGMKLPPGYCSPHQRSVDFSYIYKKNNAAPFSGSIPKNNASNRYFHAAQVTQTTPHGTIPIGSLFRLICFAPFEAPTRHNTYTRRIFMTYDDPGT